MRALLRQYISQRIVFYLAAEGRRMGQIDAETKKLQADLWSTVVHAATTQPTPIVALVVSGMNGVLTLKATHRRLGRIAFQFRLGR